MFLWGVNMLQDLFEALTKELGVSENSPLDPQTGAYTLKFDKTLIIKAYDLKPGFFFMGIIGGAPQEKKDEVYMKLMRANFLKQGTGDSIIGMDKDEKSLTLSARFPYEMKYAEFKEKAEAFANLLDFWQKELTKWQTLNNNALI